MKKFLVIFLFLCGTAQAVPFADGQPEAGKKLFDKYQCNSCHSGKMGGDGNAIFTRPNHKVKDPQQLAAQIVICARNARATLSTQDHLDLAAYLNKHFYKFK
ncbi:MAG: cytochrome c [Candidatus Nitrotoga sp.]